MNKIAEIILDIAVCGWIIFVIMAIIMTLNSCTFNENAKAMPPVHTLYEGLGAEEKEIYNSFNAEERKNVNKNTEMHQLRQALDTTTYYYE